MPPPILGRGVAGEGAAADRQRPAVVDAAAVAVAELPERVLSLTVSVPSLTMPPPPSARGVAGEGAAADRQRPFVVDAAAVGSAELPERVLPLTVSVPP